MADAAEQEVDRHPGEAQPEEKVKQYNIPVAQQKAITEAFDEADRNEDGILSQGELIRAMMKKKRTDGNLGNHWKNYGRTKRSFNEKVQLYG